jgi:recombination protein RecR
MKYGLKKFNHLVDALQNLPSVGKKSAGRLAYHMVMVDSYSSIRLAHAIEEAVRSVRKCSVCGAMSEDELCMVCSDEGRDAKTLCIVEHSKDVLLLEENGIYHGKYFVLESLDEEDVIRLTHVITDRGVLEVIFAFSPSIQNDAIMLYLEDKFKELAIQFTRIAQGVPTGVSLENIDLISLTKALEDRVKV